MRRRPLFSFATLAIALWVHPVAAWAAAAQAKPAPLKLETRTYTVPHDFLFHESSPGGATPTGQGDTPAWDPSPFGEFLASLYSARVPSAPRVILAGQGVSFPPGANVLFDPSSLTLTMRNTMANLDLAERFVTHLVSQQPRVLNVTAHLVQGPGARLRALASQIEAAQPQAFQLLLTEASADHASVQVLHTAFIETRSGQHCSLETQIDHAHTTGLIPDAQGRVTSASDIRPLGFRMEIDPATTSREDLVDIELAAELALLRDPPRQERVPDPVTNGVLEMPVTDFNSMRIQTCATLTCGRTRLMSIWPAKGDPALNAQDIHQALFITVCNVPQEPSRRFSTLSARHKTAKGLLRQTFAMPPGLFGTTHDHARVNLIVAAKRIALPEGSQVTLDTPHSLTVETTAEMMPVVEAAVGRLANAFPGTVNVTTRILRGPSSIMRPLLVECATRGDHFFALDKLRMALSTGTVRQTALAHFETRNGHRAELRSHLDQHVLTGLSWQTRRQPAFTTEHRSAGFQLDIDPAVMGSDTALEINGGLEWHFSPPAMHRELLADTSSKTSFSLPREDFSYARAQTSVIFFDSGTQVIGAWRPVSGGGMCGDDLLEIAFMTCHRVSHLPDARHSIAQAPVKRPAVGKKGESSEMFTRSFRVPPASSPPPFHRCPQIKTPLARAASAPCRPTPLKTS